MPLEDGRFVRREKGGVGLLRLMERGNCVRRGYIATVNFADDRYLIYLQKSRGVWGDAFQRYGFGLVRIPVLVSPSWSAPVFGIRFQSCRVTVTF